MSKNSLLEKTSETIFSFLLFMICGPVIFLLLGSGLLTAYIWDCSGRPPSDTFHENANDAKLTQRISEYPGSKAYVAEISPERKHLEQSCGGPLNHEWNDCPANLNKPIYDPQKEALDQRNEQTQQEFLKRVSQTTNDALERTKDVGKEYFRRKP